MSDTQQPLAYLLGSSENSLESFELTRLNRASNLRKEFLQLLDNWIRIEAEAKIARCLLEYRRTQAESGVGVAVPTALLIVASGSEESGPIVGGLHTDRMDGEIPFASGVGVFHAGR
jgi:hypothetical protein